MTDKSKNTIIPFCIFHDIDPQEKYHRGIIVNPIPNLQEDGSIVYKCKDDFGIGWKYAGTFYAVSPMFRPIPVGMKMFCAKTSELGGFSLTNVTTPYGMFNFKSECVYFIAYNQPVIHTVPLYLHKRGDNVFPSFDEVPPGPGWGQTAISPIFVMIDGIVNAKNPSATEFHCVNGRCLPWDKNEILHYNRIEEKTPYTLTECVVLCNEDISADFEEPSNILQTVALMSKEKPIISRFFKKLSPSVIGFIVGSFLLVLFILMYFLFKNKTERGK